MLRTYKMLAPIATVSFVFMFGAFTAHAQTPGVPAGSTGVSAGTGAQGNVGAQGTVNATATPSYGTTTGNTNPSGYGAGATSTATSGPGAPNTGAGASAPFNIALLSASALIAFLGASYLVRARTQARAR